MFPPMSAALNAPSRIRPSIGEPSVACRIVGSISFHQPHNLSHLEQQTVSCNYPDVLIKMRPPEGVSSRNLAS